MNWRERITVDPLICHGKPCIRGTRVMVSVVLDNLTEGETPEKVAQEFRITTQDVQTALGYAAELTRERIVPLSAGAA